MVLPKLIVKVVRYLVGENFLDGKKEGLTEKYYDSGEVWIAENHKDGAYHGLVEYFNKDGTLKKTETWNDGDMINEVNH